MKYLLIMPLLVLMLAGVACGSSTAEDIGTLTLNITDAPVDAENISGVYIKINQIDVNKDGEWITLEDFVGPQEYDLLELTGGEFALLGEFELEAGQYDQIRFILDITEQTQQSPTTPGSYVEFTDESTEPLFVPSGGQTGYKVVGSFTVPVNGDVDVTVDFDVRKALVKTGGQGPNQKYLLKPVLRLIVNDVAGDISGAITNGSEYTDIVVFAYEDGDWVATEADAPEEGEARFPEAISSAKMDDEGNYIIPFLAYETYDLVVAGYNGDEFGEVLGIISDLVLDSTLLTQDIDTGTL